MARKCDEIKDIDGKKETLKLGVRIVSLWTSKNRDRNSQLEMVVMDNKGDKIQVVLRKDEMETWAEKLVEGKTYYMYNFKVVSNEGQYKVCDHAFKLLFMSASTIVDIDLPEVPMNLYKFKEFRDIISGNYRRDMLADIIGSVHKVSYVGLNNNPKKVVLTLIDVSGDYMSCTLWEDYAMKFVDCYNKTTQAECFVILLTHARIKEAQGVYPVTVSNSFHSSKLILNEDIEEIKKFKESFAGVSVDTMSQDSQGSIRLSAISPIGSLSQSGGNSQGYGWKEFTEQDKFLYKAPVKTLSEINAVTKEETFVTVGTTGKIVVGANGWCYESCTRCNRKAEHADQPFTCACGVFNEKSMLRYKLEMEVYHHKSSSKFVFFDRECCHVIGMTAMELKTLMIKSGEINDPNVYPEPLDRMLGITMAFRIKVAPKFYNSTVMKMSDEADFVKYILDQFPTQESTNETFCSSQVETQSLSVTGEHDPDLQKLTTPAKRQAGEVQQDDTVTPEISTSKQSATKLMKHIKTE